jgi:mevalonate pyrophosphate decarboxylase
MTDRSMEAIARACANIALAKYWGKADVTKRESGSTLPSGRMW